MTDPAHRPPPDPEITEAAPRRAWDLAWPFRVATALAFITVVGLTLAQVFFRFVLDRPLIWSEELARLLVVWITFIGAAVVCWDGRHLTVDVFYNALPRVLQRLARWLNLTIAVAFLGALAWFAIPLIRIESMADLGALGIPASWVRIPALVGGGLMIVYLLLRRVYREPVERRADDDAPLSSL